MNSSIQKFNKEKQSPIQSIDSDNVIDLINTFSVQAENVSVQKIYKESESIEEYFRFIEKLDRQDLLLLLKWEVYNRVFTNKDEK